MTFIIDAWLDAAAADDGERWDGDIVSGSGVLHGHSCESQMQHIDHGDDTWWQSQQLHCIVLPSVWYAAAALPFKIAI